MSNASEAAKSMFGEGYNCAQAVLATCGATYGLPRETAIRVAQALGGGMGRTGHVCGAVSGALMVIGLKHSAQSGQDSATKQLGYRLAQEFMARFKAVHGTIICNDLLGGDISTDEGFRKIHEAGLTKTLCPRLVADAAEIIEDVLAGNPASAQRDRDTHELVKNAYAQVAQKQSGCCRPKATCCDKKPYTVPDHPVPESELGLSCGNPLAFGHINPGDVVLDLGSGAGKDVFLAAQKVGHAGKAIGVDMTPDMLDLARRNAVKFLATTGLANVEFREGQIEQLPVADASVDVAISNCVINLSPDKSRVFREVYRVLKPGGRLLVSDIVLNRPLPDAFKNDADLYAGCIAGALLREEYLAAIRAAGFGEPELLADVTYKPANAGGDPITTGSSDALAGAAASITVLAVKQRESGR